MKNILNIFIICSIAILGNQVGLLAQPASVTWLEKNKSEKGLKTLSLLRADDNAFYLLRANNASLPYLTVLDKEGVEYYNQPIPDFGTVGNSAFQASVANDSLVLFLYTSWEGNHQEVWNTRTFNFIKKQWAGAPTEVGAGKTRVANAFSGVQAGIRKSPDGQYTCVYYITPEKDNWMAGLVVLDASFRKVWQQSSPLPRQDANMLPQQIFCSNEGSVFVHSHVFSVGAKVSIAPFKPIKSLLWPNGKNVYQADYEPVGTCPSITNAVFMMDKNNGVWSSFFMKSVTKYTRSFEMTEDSLKQVICAGLGGDESLDEIDAYFFYSINPEKKSAEMLKTAKLPVGFRKAFMKDAAAEQKKPVDRAFIRSLSWSKDGKPWMLVEKEAFSSDFSFVEEAALVKIDSTWKIASTIPVPKSHKIKVDDPGSMGTVAACSVNKGSWWLLWNDGVGPSAEMMLTPAKGKESFSIATANQSGVTFLPHTLLPYKSNWYFVGESEDRKGYRVGRLSRK